MEVDSETDSENSELKKDFLQDTQPFQVVLKGGSPWGFTLKGGLEVQSPIQISQIEPGSKACNNGKLQAGDYILSVNYVKSQYLTEAVQLIQDAFRTLTLTVWRGTSKLESSVKILRSSSFLQRAREVQERERQRLGSQDDSSISKEQPGSAGERMKPGTRRIESFHGTRSGRLRNSSSGSTSSITPVSSPCKQEVTNNNNSPSQQTEKDNSDDGGFNDPKQMELSAKDKLRGWATVQDLSQEQLARKKLEQAIGNQNNGNVTNPIPPNRSGPLSPAMSTPTLNSPDPQQQRYSQNAAQRLNISPSKSSPSIGDLRNQPTSPTSPTGLYSSSKAQSQSGFQYPQGYHKMAWGNKENNKNLQYGYNMYENMKMKNLSPSVSDIGHTAPEKMTSDSHDYQNIDDFKSGEYKNQQSYPQQSLSKDHDGDMEIQNLTSKPMDYDLRPPSSPPAPPIRDVSSLKFSQRNQSHEKYPSWPVTQPSIETEAGEPITSPKSKINYHPQLGTVKERNNSPNSERKSSDEYKRNASDPGFKKPIPFSNFMQRPKPADISQKGKTKEDILKQTADKMDDFFNSQPGYPQPQLDQDGHHIGDEKYNIPSPPERDNGHVPDQKTLSEKIASIVGPHHDSYHSNYASVHSSDSKKVHDFSSSLLPSQDSKRDLYKRGNSPQSKNISSKPPPLVDTGTSPLHSPDASKFSSPNLSGHLLKPKDRPSESNVHYYDQHKSYIVKQMVCYNTGTQTESDFQETKEMSPSWSKEQNRGVPEKIGQTRGSNSENENSAKFGASDSIRNSSNGAETLQSGTKVNRYSGGSEREFIHRNRTSSGNEFDSKDFTHYSEYPANMAPMLRKLTHEYYGGKLQGSISEKRLSSASSHDSSLRSPGSDYPTHVGQYSGMKEAESYNSIIIHPQDNLLPFGRDYTPESRANELANTDSERGMSKPTEPRSAFKAGRHSLDPTMFSPKYPLINTGSKSLHDQRYSSEANLQSPKHSHRDYGGSMMSLQGKHTKTASLSDELHSRLYQRGSESSQARSPSDSRSSGNNRYSADSSPLAAQGQYKTPRRESSDSVFVESPSQFDSSLDSSTPSARRPSDFNVPSTRNMNRSASMKKAYGVYEDYERTHSTSGMHKRQESDLTSNSSHFNEGSSVVHSRSHSQSEYMHMENYRRIQDDKHLTLIREDSSEVRWEEAVRKSKSLTQRPSNSSSEKSESNYANIFQSINTGSNVSKNQGTESAKVERTNLKRTSSEQIRPKKMQKHLQRESPNASMDYTGRINRSMFGDMKDWKNSANSQSPDKTANVSSPTHSQIDLRQRLESSSHVQSPPNLSHQNLRNLSDSDQTISAQPQVESRLRAFSDSSVKDERNIQPKNILESDSKTLDGPEEIPSSPSGTSKDMDIKRVQRDALKDYVERKTHKYSSDSSDERSLTKDEPLFSDKEKPTHGSTLTPTESFRQKYAHRAESLRRSRSITSRDSDYVEMKRPERPHPQTEWSRIRSQTNNGRPHSIGSDSSLVDPYAVTPLSSSYLKDHFLGSDNHQRSQSDSASSQRNARSELSVEAEKDAENQEDDASSSGISKNSLIYQNVGYRRPPPPLPPGAEEDMPPALPPRNYRRFQNSQSDSSLLQQQQRQQPQPQVDSLHKNDQSEDLNRKDVTGPKNKWDNTPDNYAEQLRKQARRLSEQQQQMPPPMSYISNKIKINYSQSYKRPQVEALEATPPGSMNSPVSDHSHQASPTTPSGHTMPPSPPMRPQRISPDQSPSQTPTSVASPSHHSPQTNIESVPDRPRPRLSGPPAERRPPPPPVGSPEPPPPPTPQKEVPDNVGDLPPPPPEVVDSSYPNNEDVNEEEDPNGYAVDSYGYNKNKSNRQPGVYKRSVSTGDALKILQENNNYKQQAEIQKPPRKRLQQQVWKSDLDIKQQNNEPDSGSIPAFKAQESVPVTSVHKSVAKPLVHSQSANLLYAPKPYNSPDSLQNKQFSSQEYLQNKTHHSSNQSPEKQLATEQNISTSSNQNNERLTVRERISSFEKKPPNEWTVNSKSNSSNSVGNLKQPVDNFSRTSVDSSSRRSYEPPTSNSVSKFSNSYSESRLQRYSNDSDMTKQSPELPRSFSGAPTDQNTGGHITPPRKPSLTSDQNRIHLIGQYGSNTRDPPPVDRSRKIVYSGSGQSEDRLQKQRGSFDSSYHRPYERFDPQERRNSGSNSNTENSGKSSNDVDHSRHVVVEQNGDSYSQENVSSLSNKDSVNTLETSLSSANHGRQRSQEELDCDAKVQEFAKIYKEKDPKLSTVLRSDTVGRMQYMDGLFPMDIDKDKLNSRRSPKHSPKSSSVSEHSDSINRSENKEEETSQQDDKLEKSSVPSSYWVSPSKAMIEMDIRKSDEIGKEMTKDIGDSDTLIKTKEELVQSIQRKMEKLEEEKKCLMSEISETDKIGKQVEGIVEQKCQSQHEKEKFKSYVVDMEKITKLLLKLSGLLARAENALQSLPETADARQRKMASDKRERLQLQHEEAKNLKDDIDKRSNQVLTFLKESLSESELGDYDYFIQMKSKQMIEVQELEDKITLGKEQIVALRRSIPDSH